MKRAKGGAMRRRKPDRRVREILAAFDYVVAHPVHGPEDSLPCGFMCSVAGTAVERFQIPGGWSDAAIRELLVAFLSLMPDDEIDEAVTEARKERAWVDEFALQQEFEATTDHGCFGPEFEAWKQARLSGEAN